MRLSRAKKKYLFFSRRSILREANYFVSLQPIIHYTFYILHYTFYILHYSLCIMNYNKIILRLLTLLGIGSASFMFMACYGPAPQSYNVNPEDLDSLTVDSLYHAEVDSVDFEEEAGA